MSHAQARHYVYCQELRAVARSYVRDHSVKHLFPAFDPQAWATVFEEVRQVRSDTGFHSLRLFVQFHTFASIAQGQYHTADGTRVPIPKEDLLRCVQQTRVYSRGAVPPPSSSPRPQSAVFAVVEGDCLLAASKLRASGHGRVAVLNMANAHTPGGGYQHGDGAQEENLHRRSTYSAVLGDPHHVTGSTVANDYPIVHKAVYSPGVLVFRGLESDGYPFLAEPYEVDMIAVPAVCKPRMNGPEEMDEYAVDEMRQRMRTLLDVAALHGVDGLVLSALGCGAFRCPPRHVARLFREELGRVIDRFATVCFAIFEDHNAFKPHNPEGNVRPFAETFGVEAVPVQQWVPHPQPPPPVAEAEAHSVGALSPASPESSPATEAGGDTPVGADS